MNRNKNNRTTNAKRNNALQKNDPNQLAVTTQQYSGPIPPPNILEGFERIVPGSAERILRMAEQNSEHQQAIEKLALTSRFKEVRRGQIFGLVAVICALATCLLSLYLGSEKAAMIIGGTTIVGLAAAFIVGRYKQSDD